jgi:hypothetical protein
VGVAIHNSANNSLICDRLQVSCLQGDMRDRRGRIVEV